tara:strand:- start:138 stop:668 length:531 start_codon:yes stop_codon:yes gene_type:complete
MALIKVNSQGITDGTILGEDINSTFDLTGKTVTLPAGVGGKVLQSKYMQSSSGTTLASTSLTDLPLTNTITPSSASSKIFIQFFIQAKLQNGEGYGTAIKRTISASDTTLNEMESYYCLNYTTGGEFGTPNSYMFEDSPNTTSEITYTVQVKGNSAANIEIPNASFNSLLIMEIAV